MNTCCLRGRSSDWGHDGGIFRPVQILIAPKVFVERVDVEATPNLSSGGATIAITSNIRNTSPKESDTFKGMGPQPDADIVENGLEQLREMIAAGLQPSLRGRVGVSADLSRTACRDDELGKACKLLRPRIRSSDLG